MTVQHPNRIRRGSGNQAVCELEKIEVAEPFDNHPTEEEIRHRAHEIYMSRNGAPGNAALDWLQAEIELRA